MEFYLYYKEKRKLKWFYDSINNGFHRVLIMLIIIIIYGQLLAIGFEVIYDEGNIKNKDKENIIFPLILCFITSLVYFTIWTFIIYKILKDNIDSTFNKVRGKFELLSIILIITFLLISLNIIYSLFFSITYLSNKDYFFKEKHQYYPIIVNKFIIFMLSYFSIIIDLETEIISNSSFSSVYLYIIELIFSLIKELIP